MVGSYAVLFAADEVGLSPVQVGVFVSAPAVGGILVSSLLGRRFDRRPTRRYAALVAVGGALGLSAMAVSRSFVVLVVVALTLMGPLSAAFPQLFTLARFVLGDGAAGRRSAPLLRSGWSLAWAVGPLLGAAVLARSGYPPLLLAAAATLLLTAVLTLTVPRPRTAAANAEHDEPSSTAQTPSARMGRLPLALLVAGVAAFFTSMYAGSVALPLFVTRALHQPDSSVGALYSACAAVEVVAALALAALPPWVSQRALITGGMVAFILYFGLTVIAGGMPLLLAGQVARGIGIAVVGAAGIRFFQEALAPETGRATTLFSNASTAGSLVAGVLAGAAVRAVGYTSALALCGALAVLATVLFVAGSSPRMRARDREPEEVLSSAAG
jgi:SET family sugar efflux transporter-like MFS transporter